VSPITTVIIAGIVGLLGTILGGILNLRVERKKQQGLLILEGIKTGDTRRAATNLLFFSEAGLINLSHEQIGKLREEAGDSTIPVLPRPHAAPDKIDFSPSAALTPEVKQKLSEVLAAFQEYSKKIGFKISKDKVDIKVTSQTDVETGAAYEGQIAYYDQLDKSIVVASEYADDANTVLRQYAHHLLTTSNKTISNRDGYTAIESGLASYFPCNFTQNPAIGDLNLVNDRKFSEISLDDWASVQRDGSEIWGGAFWDIDQLLGHEMANQLLYSTWVNLKVPAGRKNPYTSFAKSMLDNLDEATNFKPELEEIFERRGLAL